MSEIVKAFDEDLFLFLNSHHNAFFDNVMWLFSGIYLWIPLYAWFLWLLYKRFPKHFWTVLVAIALMIALSDQLCNLSKVSVMRLRPTHELHLQALVHTVNGYRGGMFGFYSAHASNNFAIACFMINSIESKRKYLIPFSLICAMLIAYSRVYLGVHYPGDIITGAIVGVIVGTFFAYIHKKLRTRYMASDH